MKRKSNPVSTILLLLIALGIFGVVLWLNATPQPTTVSILPTQSLPTEIPNAWSEVLRDGFGDSSTPLPTVAIPTQQPPTQPALALPQVTTTPLSPEDLADDTANNVGVNASTPTSLPPTVAPLEDDGNQPTVQSVTREPAEWNPPPLIPPISRDPLGRDHYWLRRPVESNARNAVLWWYSYGSDGNDPSNPLRVHHGIDMPNDIGEFVRAAGSGTVVWSADGRQAETDIFQNSPAYGNVIVIEHDFGYRGQPIYTLYAHLSAALVREGDIVEAGQAIGLVGNTGRVSGPHVHFEVRVGENRYGSTYNPILWMVPYVGHGVIAGRVIDNDGNIIMDADITIRNWATGLQEATTTSYVFLDSGFDVNADPEWQENFVVPDVPVGRYDVITTINGQRILQQVEVFEGMTAFVELKPPEPVETSD
jgi:murein DD-endopeptidase MepM/ murein hydrolase activator NlpD